MRQTIQYNDYTGLTRPEQFLLPDESAIEYTERRGELMANHCEGLREAVPSP